MSAGMLFVLVLLGAIVVLLLSIRATLGAIRDRMREPNAVERAENERRAFAREIGP